MTISRKFGVTSLVNAVLAGVLIWVKLDYWHGAGDGQNLWILFVSLAFVFGAYAWALWLLDDE